MTAMKLLRLTLLTVLLATSTSAVSEIVNEHKIKAAIVYKILRFVSWPEMVGNGAKISLCVANDDPFFEAFTQIDGREVAGQQLTLVDPTTSLGPENCNVEFTSLIERENELLQIADALSPPVLSISNNEHFAQRGGMISLAIRNNRVGFDINVNATDRSGIKISSSLLRLANIVSSDSAGDTP